MQSGLNAAKSPSGRLWIGAIQTTPGSSPTEPLSVFATMVGADPAPPGGSMATAPQGWHYMETPQVGLHRVPVSV